jgi:O-antigen/teichoic acid export membrane protein
MYYDAHKIDSPTEPSTIKVEAQTTQKKKHIGASAFIGTFSTSIFVQACTVVQGIIIARLLGPVGRGEYAAIMLWPNIISSIGIFGTNIALARIVAQTDQYDRVIRTGILLAFTTAFISSTICYLSLPYLLPEDSKHLLNLSRLFILFIPIEHFVLNFIAIDQGMGNFKRFNYTKVLFSPIYISFLLGMWISGNHKVEFAAIGMLIAYLIVVLVRFMLVLKDINILGRLYPPFKTIYESALFGVVGAIQPLYLYADKVILLWILGTENLGLYTAALSASAVISSITFSTGFVSFTMTAQEKQGQGFEKVAKVFSISALLWFFLGFGLLLVMSTLLPLVYGKEFEPAVDAARLLILGSAFSGLANLLDQTLRGQGQAFVGIEGRILGLAVMVLTGVIFSYWIGLSGMCVAFILGQFTCLSFFIWRTIRHYKVNVKHIWNYLSIREDLVNLFKRSI